MLKVTLIHSLIGSKPNQKKTAAALGLSKIGDCFEAQETQALAGMIKIVSHLVKVEKTGA